MRLGMLLRNSGPAATAELIASCARAAEEIGLDDLFVLDHIAIPPDEAEGSGGRYLDPLATLAFASAITRRIGLGTAVLVLPYRPPLITAKWVATVQELCQGRLTLGVGAGWMEAEFRAAGIARSARGRLTDETLAFLHECFSQDVVTAHDQPFIFSPRPARPRVLIGGQGAHVVRRVLAWGDGWMPTGGDVDALRGPIADLTAALAGQGRPAPLVVPLLGVPVEDPAAAAAQLSNLAAIGCTGVAHLARYASVDAFSDAAAALIEARARAGLAAPD